MPGEHGRHPGVERHDGRSVVVERHAAAAGLGQVSDTGPHAPGHGRWVVALVRQAVVERRAMRPAAVCGTGGIEVPGGVVLLTEFVAHVDDRDAAVSERDPVQEQQTRDRVVERQGVVGVDRSGDPGERGRHPARPLVTSDRVGAERGTTGE